MRGLLVDTNHLSQALKPHSSVRAQLKARERLGWRIGILVPVLCELWISLLHSAHCSTRASALRELLRKTIRIWPMEESMARVYAELAIELRAKGRALSQVDMMLAAHARCQGLVLLTADRDFEALPDLRTENWLTPP